MERFMRERKTQWKPICGVVYSGLITGFTLDPGGTIRTAVNLELPGRAPGTLQRAKMVDGGLRLSGSVND